MPIIDLLETAKLGLTAHRETLQTSSNNIANVNTPGYSRQKTVLTTLDQPTQISTASSARMRGVEVKECVRVHDGFIRNQILDEVKHYANTQARTEGFRRIEGIVHNDGYRIGDLVNKFFNDFRELSTNPEMSTLMTNVVYSAESTCSAFRGLSNSLTGLNHNLDQQISVAVAEVNTLAKEIARFNDSIAQFNAKGETPLELLDRRDVSLRKLADKIGFELSKDGKDNANIAAGGLGILVNGNMANELVVMRTAGREGKQEGALDVFVKQSDGYRQVTNHITEGNIGGMLHIRDKVVFPAMKHLDATAFQFARAVNEVHREGVGRDGLTGRNLFSQLDGAQGAAGLLGLNSEVKSNSEAIAVGMTPGARGDNRIALRIAELQEKQIVSENPGRTFGAYEESAGQDAGLIKKSSVLEGHQTINESLNGLVGSLAVQAEHEDQLFRHREAILNQMENYEKSVSGVNLDEEAINLIQFQAAFNASAKALKLGDELLQTVLNLR